MCCVMQCEQPAVELFVEASRLMGVRKKNRIRLLFCCTLNLLLLLAFIAWFHSGAVVSLMCGESMVAASSYCLGLLAVNPGELGAIHAQ